MSVYETHVMKDPQLPFIFHRNTVSSNSARFIPTNWHENVEIIHVIDGQGAAWIDNERIPLCAGDIAVIDPNSLHTFTASDGTLFYDCLIVDRAFCIANHFDTNTIRFQKAIRDVELSRLLGELVSEYTAPLDGAYRVQTVRALVLSIMARLCRLYSHPAGETDDASYLLSCIKQAIGFVRSNFARNVSLDEISRFVGLSKFYFSREFRRITGYTFVSYLNLVRCEQAKVLLLENRLTVGEVGRACGFDNPSYFSHTFRNYTGILPATYRAKKNG